MSNTKTIDRRNVAVVAVLLCVFPLASAVLVYVTLIKSLGRLSTTLAPWAKLGPALVTTMVYVSCVSPGTARVTSSVFVICRSTTGVNSVSLSVAVLLCSLSSVAPVPA